MDNSDKTSVKRANGDVLRSDGSATLVDGTVEPGTPATVKEYNDLVAKKA